jgi:mannose-6-phosphate isomerase-like protein (cupin superfamily)
MGALSAVFKADGEETENRFCVSEWWLDPHTKGPGAHLHEENYEVFYIIGGRPAVLVGEEWVEATTGSFFLIPPRTMHDFENRTGAKAGLLNVFIPGGFEPKMPAIVKWFAENR